MDFAQSGAIPDTIWTGGMYGVGVGTRAPAAGSNPFASTAWATANLAILCPVFIPCRYPVKNLFVYNFATLGGNVDVGIYSEDLQLLASSGSTVQAGASTIQFFAKDIVLRPGQYYFGMSSSSTTATFAASQLGTATRERYFGLLQMATALPLPQTFVPASVANARVPGIGITWRSGTPAF